MFRDQLGFTRKAKHHIRTGDAAPIVQHPYRIRVAWQPAVRDEVKQMLDSGMIEHSDSPLASPVVCVRKKDGALRMCVDYRKLNSVTDDDVYPIEELLDQIGKAKFVATLDLAKGYYQVPVSQRGSGQDSLCHLRGEVQIHKDALWTERGVDNLSRHFASEKQRPCILLHRRHSGVQ